MRERFDDAWRADRLEHPGERGDWFSLLFVYLPIEHICVVRLGYFLNGDRAALHDSASPSPPPPKA